MTTIANINCWEKVPKCTNFKYDLKLLTLYARSLALHKTALSILLVSKPVYQIITLAGFVIFLDVKETFSEAILKITIT